jgi:hypothetical protein
VGVSGNLCYGAGFRVLGVEDAGSGFHAFRGLGGGFGYFPFAPLVDVVTVGTSYTKEQRTENK